MKISLIGAGNVAWHLGQILEKQGHQILEVFSKNFENAEKLTRKLQDTIPQNHLDFSKSKSELFILAVKDDIFLEALEKLKLPLNTIVVHTSGSQNLDILTKAKEKNNIKIGVFYPLQTFSKHKDIDFTNIPFCIEGEDKATSQKLFNLAQDLSESVQFITSEQRQFLHLSAVFACNFSNHMFTISKRLLEKEAMSFDLLKPLIQETLEKAFKTNPQTAQTGPAQRGDIKTIEKHLNLIEDATYDEIYRLISKSIMG